MLGPIEVTFYLKCDNSGSNIPYIVGDHPALGNNKEDKAIPLLINGGAYNHTVKIIFDEPITKPIILCLV